MPPSTELRKSGLVHALRTCRLFAGLPGEELEAIASFTVGRSLQRGEYLFREGDPAVGFYIVQRGAINIHRVSAAGREQVLHIFRPGESFAEGSVASDQGYPANARALESTQVLLVQKAGMVEHVRQHPEIALNLIASINRNLRLLIRQFDDLTLKDVETRLAKWLLRHCPATDDVTPVCLCLVCTKRVLAAELGTVSETLSRTLARFREQQLITVNGRSITILQPCTQCCGAT